MRLEGGARLAVMGGCGGIGRAVVAEALARRLRVAVLDLPQSLERHPVADGVDAYPLDALDAGQVEAAFAALGSAWGGLDGFVNLAGFSGGDEPIADMEPSAWREIVDGNVTATYLGAKFALPLLRRGEGAALVNTASGLAFRAAPGYGPYSAAKAAIVALSRTLALENAPLVRVNTVAPSAVDTAFLRGGTGRSDERQAPRVDLAAYTRAIPLQRIAEPADVVGPILFLLSDAARYMTGQVLHVNGGLLMP